MMGRRVGQKQRNKGLGPRTLFYDCCFFVSMLLFDLIYQVPLDAPGV